LARRVSRRAFFLPTLPSEKSVNNLIVGFLTESIVTIEEHDHQHAPDRDW
jgi:hypothetical protein